LRFFGEAASRISAELRVVTPQVPWADIIGMRNRLVHAYFDIDPDIIWQAAIREMPALVPVLRSPLPKD
jgi:uncharacterized protein with HEPN domain